MVNEKGEILTTKGWQELFKLEKQRILELVDKLKKDIEEDKILEVG